VKIRIDALDRLFSKYVRLRAKGVCERCGSNKGVKGLQCSHYHGRAKKSVRWDEDNAAALCYGCHRYFTAHPYEHTEWFKTRLGEYVFNMLSIRARTPQKVDKEMIKLYLKEKIKELEK